MLNYTPKYDEMVLTVHWWFANKSCPGNWMYARMGDLAKFEEQHIHTISASADGELMLTIMSSLRGVSG